MLARACLSECRPSQRGLLLLAPCRTPEAAEDHRLGHAQQADRGVRARFARADVDVRAVRADHLDDRAHVADLAVLAIAPFQRLHLGGHYLADLALVERHPRPPEDRWAANATDPPRNRIRRR